MPNVPSVATLQPLRDIALPGYWGPQYSVFAPDGSYAVICSREPVVDVFGVASIALQGAAFALALLMLIIAGTLAYFRIRRHEHPAVPICARCAYRLPESGHGLPERCSECGAELGKTRAVRLGRTRLRRAKPALVLTVLSVSSSVCGVFSPRIVGVFVHPEAGSRSLYDAGVSFGLITPGAIPPQRFVNPYGLVVRRLDVRTEALTVLAEASGPAAQSRPVISNDSSRFAIATYGRALVFDGATGATERVLVPDTIEGAPAGAELYSLGGFSDDGSSLYGVWTPLARFMQGDSGLFV
ncbi:MAG: hypothetical protein AAGH64_00660 [Planctomycetota bacterium]